MTDSSNVVGPAPEMEQRRCPRTGSEASAESSNRIEPRALAAAREAEVTDDAKDEVGGGERI